MCYGRNQPELFKVDNRNTRKMCICSRLTRKKSARRQWQISFFLLTLNRFCTLLCLEFLLLNLNSKCRLRDIQRSYCLEYFGKLVYRFSSNNNVLASKQSYNDEAWNYADNEFLHKHFPGNFHNNQSPEHLWKTTFIHLPFLNIALGFLENIFL